MGAKTWVKRVMEKNLRNRLLPYGWSEYRHSQGIRTQSTAEAGILASAAHSGTVSPVRVVYDDAFSPPTYGDFFAVVMAARFLSLSGIPCAFEIRAPRNRRSDWDLIPRHEQEQFIGAQVEIARRFLPEGVAVHIYTVESDWQQSDQDDPRRVLFQSLVSQNRPIYRNAASLVTMLVSRHSWKLPAGFLLSKSPKPTWPEVSQGPVTNPYITWNVRRSTWDSSRNSTEEVILDDARGLLRSFPGHDLMLLSTANGLDFAESALTRAGITADMGRSGTSLLRQPIPGFLAAVETLLSSSFYFQRMGGGLHMVPVYSTVPYLIIHRLEADFFFRGQHDGVVPWAEPNQRWIAQGHNSETITFDEITRRKLHRSLARHFHHL